jgi:hypothetical protein
MSPRQNWDSPTLSLASECASRSTPQNREGGGGHTRLRVRGRGSPYLNARTAKKILSSRFK